VIEKGGPIGGNVTYCVRIRNGASSTDVHKRYSEFEAMHKAITGQFGEARSPKFPPKKMFGNMSAQFLEQRKVELEGYIKSVVADAGILNQSQALWEFLNVIPPAVVVQRFIAAVSTSDKSPVQQVASLAELSEDPETWPEITKKECLQALVQLCKATKEDPVQQSACRVMVNLTVETANRQALIEAGGFPACLMLSLHAAQARVQQAVHHIINQMARPETVISVIDCGGMTELTNMAQNEKDGNEVLRTAALFAWRASVSPAGKASLLDRGVLGLLSQLTASSSIVAQFLGHLVAAVLVVDVEDRSDWQQPMAELKAFVSSCDEDTAQANIPKALPLAVDVERVAAMAASPESHAQVLAAWTFSILALDEESKPRVKQSGAHSALASAMQSTDRDTRKFAARALLELLEMEGSAAHNTAQAMELRLAVADEMLNEAADWDSQLGDREGNFSAKLQELQPTVDTRGEDLAINLGFLSKVVENSNALAQLRERLKESQVNGIANCKSFGDSTRDSQARTNILKESCSSMQETLHKAKELSNQAMTYGDEAQAVDGEEDEAVQLQKVKEGLAKKLDMHNTDLKAKAGAAEAVEAEMQGVQKELDHLTNMIQEGPQMIHRLEDQKKGLEAQTQDLGEKLAVIDSEIAGLIEEKARLSIEKKKMSKKEARVTSLKETLSTMQEMESDTRQKAEELAAMDEMMRGKMEEMQKMQRMMQSMMSQVMAGMGDLDGENEDVDDNPDSLTEIKGAAGESLSEAEKQSKMIQELVDKVTRMSKELIIGVAEIMRKIAAVDEQIADAQARKAGLTAEVQANAAQIAKVCTDLDNCADPQALSAEKERQQEALHQIIERHEHTQAELTAVTAATEDARTRLEGHDSAVGTLQSLVRDTHAVMADWEIKMRKHVQKRKRLVALSNTFGVDIQDIQNRCNDEKTHWKESLKPLIQDSISQLGTLLEQLDREA